MVCIPRRCSNSGNGMRGSSAGSRNRDRKVSSARNLAASLPMVVVFPDPLTPTTSMTKGFASPIPSGLATGVSTFSTSAATTAFTSSAVIDLS